MIAVTVIPVLKDNYAYLIRSSDGVTAVVDPGDAGPVIKALEREGLTLDYILNTHHHGDHTAGNKDLKTRYGAIVLAPGAERDRIASSDQGLKDGELFMLGKDEMRCIETPGHTAGHYSLMVELANRRPMLFTADACYSQKNMDMMCISSFHLDPTASLNSMKRLQQLAEKHDAELFYSHDPDSFGNDIKAPGYYS